MKAGSVGVGHEVVEDARRKNVPAAPAASWGRRSVGLLVAGAAVAVIGFGVANAFASSASNQSQAAAGNRASTVHTVQPGPATPSTVAPPSAPATTPSPPSTPPQSAPPAPSPSTGIPAAAVTLPGAPTCGDSAPEIRATFITLACGDGTVTLSDINWTSWGSSSATGTGSFGTVQCVPNCAQGTETKTPASITLSDPSTGNGGPVFQNVSVVPLTGGGQAQTFTIRAGV